MTQIPNSRRITAFLNIEPGEERLISLLVLLYFILSLGVVFVQSMAFGVFIAEYGVQGLPYSYISIAFLASLVAVLYIRIGGRVSFARLLSINLIFLAVTTLLIWIVLNTPLYHAATFILPLWFQTAINLVNIAVWPLGGSLFDLRQGKRLFPLLGAGNWLANIVAGLFVPTLVKTIGTTNLLLLAVLSFGLSLFVLRAISRSYLQPKPNTPVAQSARPAKTPTAMFKDRYVRLIFVYITLWWAAFYFADNIFYDRAFAQFPDAAQLTAFIGQLLSIIGVVALLSSTVITGRVIARFGLRVGLIAMPLVVTATLGILAISGSLGASLLIVFALGAFAKLINVAFGFSLSQSANAIIYQSLPDSIRTRVQATAEGIVQPIAIGLAGLSLLALTAGLKFNYIGLAYVAVAVGAVWLIVIVLLSGNYVQALTRVITRRRLGDDAMVLADPASITILRDQFQDAHPGVVIYALNKLETLDGQAVVGELPKLMQHPTPDVRRDAFSRIETLKLRSALSDVQQQLLVEPDPSVKEAALRALGAITDNPAQFVHALSEMDTAAQRGALIGLLKYGNEPIAKQKLDGLLAAASADHILAIEVLGAVNRREYHPQLISACDAPETSRAAGMALAAIGADILPEIETAFAQPDAPRERLLTLPRALGRIGGEHSQNILLSRMFTSDGDVRSQFINALSQSGYCTRDQAAIRRAINLVQEQLCQLHPHIRDQIHVVPSLRNISEPERTRYLEAKELDWDTLQRQSILDTMQQAGQKVTSFDPQQGFRHVRFAELRAGEKLIEAGAPATFVYIPLGDGLKIIPLGGYQSFSVAAWMPLGTTGVIRGDTRNADIIAEQHVALLIIPKEVYLRYWYDPYSPVELMRLLSEGME